MDGCVLVAVDGAAFTFDKLYSYLVPPHLAHRVTVGSRVLVPFGKGKPRMGVVLDTDPAADTAGLKALLDAEGEEPLLDGELVRLVLYLRETTFCTYYDAVRAVLPKSSRLVPGEGMDTVAQATKGYLEQAFSYIPIDPPPRLTEKQRAVCEAVTEAPLTFAEIRERTGVSRDVVNRLADKDILKRVQRHKTVALYGNGGETTQPIPPLTAAQSAAYESIVRAMDDPQKPDTTLLHGVTSSGKTLIYIKLIERAVSAGKSALMLVPEIAIATQTILRLRSLFGDRVAILHSALSDTERMLEWERIRKGECDIVVGTRSAVFAPCRNLGLIILDEEQEAGYVSEQNPRYDAAAVAAFRVKENGAQLLLSSATPSVHTYHRAKTGAYNLVELTARYGDMPLPSVRVVDMRRELLAGNSHIISQYLKEQIDLRLAKKEQCILLLNRRGYRTVSMCRSCKTIVKCPSCDTPMVLHKQTMRHTCHYCGRSAPVAEVCESCGGAIMHTGVGTQKIEEELETLFPTARILRLDLDSVGRKDAMQTYLRAFAAGEYDILVGTQMIAKGLDFGNVTLAGVLSIDQLLLMPSFRAGERTFSMLTQVVGRSGRGEKEGEAIIQTIDPENPIIRLAARQDYASFYEDEIVLRKAHLYPPFCALCTVGFAAAREPDAREASARFVDILRTVSEREEYRGMPLRVLGPAPMRVAYVNDIHRYKITIKCRRDGLFRRFLRECVAAYHKDKKNEPAKLFVDLWGEYDC